jgi:hypothetical protein
MEIPANQIIEYSALMDELTYLPPEMLLHSYSLSKKQQRFWEEAKHRWVYLTNQIDYLQMKQAGYNPSPPLLDVSPAYKEIYEVESALLFTKLQIMIAGFDLIKEASKQCQIGFNFESPRDLFIEACKQEFNLLCDNFLRGQSKNESSLTDVRTHYKISNAFYRDRLNKIDTKTWLEDHKNCNHWFRFIIYAIWNHRHKNPVNPSDLSLRSAWQLFLKAYKFKCKQVCDKTYFSEYGCKITVAIWRSGQAFDSQYKSPLIVPSYDS